MTNEEFIKRVADAIDMVPVRRLGDFLDGLDEDVRKIIDLVIQGKPELEDVIKTTDKETVLKAVDGGPMSKGKNRLKNDKNGITTSELGSYIRKHGVLKFLATLSIIIRFKYPNLNGNESWHDRQEDLRARLLWNVPGASNRGAGNIYTSVCKELKPVHLAIRDVLLLLGLDPEMFNYVIKIPELTRRDIESDELKIPDAIKDVSPRHAHDMVKKIEESAMAVVGVIAGRIGPVRKLLVGNSSSDEGMRALVSMEDAIVKEMWGSDQGNLKRRVRAYNDQIRGLEHNRGEVALMIEKAEEEVRQNTRIAEEMLEKNREIEDRIVERRKSLSSIDMEISSAKYQRGIVEDMLAKLDRSQDGVGATTRQKKVRAEEAIKPENRKRLNLSDKAVELLTAVVGANMSDLIETKPDGFIRVEIVNIIIEEGGKSRGKKDKKDPIITKGMNLSESNFSGSVIREAYLDGTNFTDAKFIESDLRGTNLGKSDFSRADLRGADLRGTVASGTDFANADLRGADIREVKGIAEANFRGANITGAKLSPGVVLDTTSWEDGSPESGSFQMSGTDPS